MNITTNTEKLSVSAESFMAADFYDFEAEHLKTMQDPCLAHAYKISDRFAEIANQEKLKAITKDPLDFEAIEKVHLKVERRMNALVSRIQQSYLAKVKKAELVSLGKPSDAGLPQFPAGGFVFSNIA